MSLHLSDKMRSLLMLWMALVLAPLSWMIAFGSVLGLTRKACAEGNPFPLAIICILCTVLALFAAWLGYELREHGNGDTPPEPHRHTFMRELAIGAGVVFALVNALSTVPVFVLSPCPH